MSTGHPITPASAESMQRTIGALAARNVEAVLLQSREVALTKLKGTLAGGFRGLRQHLGDADGISYTEICTATTAT